MQKCWKSLHFYVGAFLSISEELLGLLHGCCTEVAALASAQGPG
jgi:hypothetical protein